MPQSNSLFVFFCAWERCTQIPVASVSEWEGGLLADTLGFLWSKSLRTKTRTSDPLNLYFRSD